MRTTSLYGQDTLVDSWRALARHSASARVEPVGSTVAAIFPSWAPLNNAILLGEPTASNATSAATELADLYRRAGVATWALWLPSLAASLTDPDRIVALDGLQRDTTTLVMQRALDHDWPLGDGVVRTSIDAAGAAGEDPIPAAELPAPDRDSAMNGWVIVRDELAVAGAWSLVVNGDCGVYAVETVPAWRRRGLARALMQSLLGDAYRNGARTATLQSTPMGEALYRSLDFEPIGRYEEWVPA